MPQVSESYIFVNLQLVYAGQFRINLVENSVFLASELFKRSYQRTFAGVVNDRSARSRHDDLQPGPKVTKVMFCSTDIEI